MSRAALTRLGAAGLMVATALAAPPGAGRLAAVAPAIVQACATTGHATQSGNAVISGPMVAAITGTGLDLDLDATATATPAVAPGGLVTTIAHFATDLSSEAGQILTQRVQPAIASAGHPELVSGSWVTLDLPRATVTFGAPAGATASGTPSAGSPSTGAVAAWAGSDATVTIGPLHADSRVTASPVEVSAGWRRRDGGAAAPRSLATPPPSLAFTATVTVGVLLYGSPLTGSVTASWTCHPTDSTSLADTAVEAAPVSTTSPEPLPVAGPPPGPVPTTAPPTTWPSTPPVAAGACVAPRLDRYGGDATVALHSTGRFRTQRIGAQWWLVDPDGHPFWSAGVNHVTFDGTPDRNGVAEYRDAVTARYGTPAKWATAELGRLRSWGYDTLGAWSDTDTFADRMPYTLLLDVTGSDASTGRMQDLWEPAWSAGVDSAMAAAAAAHGADPMLVGYWFDNELHWGPDWRPLHLLDEYLGMDASAPGKQALISWLQARYPSFAAFAADVSTTAHSWADLAGPTTATGWTRTGGAATRSAWVGQVADRYFRITREALDRYDPSHLDLGARLIAQTAGAPVLAAATRYTDVISLNDYAITSDLSAGLTGADPTYLPVDGPLRAQAAATDKPILVSEWGFRAADAGLPNTWPPLFPTLQTQAQRAAASESFVLGLLGNHALVGEHIFEFTDEPPAGRFDGENSNFGLVDLHDDPYPALAAIGPTVTACAYARLHQETATVPPTTSGPTTPTVPAAPAASPIEGAADFTG